MNRFLFLVFCMLFPLFSCDVVYAAPDPGECEATTAYGSMDKTMLSVINTCQGDNSTGAVADLVMPSAIFDKVKGMRLDDVETYIVPLGVTPSNANVFVFTAQHLDLLGSPDNGTTAGQADILDNTTTKRIQPFPVGSISVQRPKIRNPLTLHVTDQTTPLGQFIIQYNLSK